MRQASRLEITLRHPDSHRQLDQGEEALVAADLRRRGRSGVGLRALSTSALRVSYRPRQTADTFVCIGLLLQRFIVITAHRARPHL